MSMQQTIPEVFWASGSPYSWRVLLTLAVKGIAYESRLLEFSKGETKTPEYLALNPRGKVPTLRHEGLVLFESLAIMQYLDATYPEPPIFGRDPREKGTVGRVISEFSSYLADPLLRIVRPIFFGKIAEKRDDIREATTRTDTELRGFESATTDSPWPWLAAETVSAADIAVYPFLKALLRAAAKPEAIALDLGLLPFDQKYPALAAWMERVEKLPGYERTYPPHWRA